MIFILKELIMNGTVTMQTIVNGIEADSFEQVIEKLQNHVKANHKAKMNYNHTKYPNVVEEYFTIRWYGESNGYYCEEVDFYLKEKEKEND